jgi:hypothetical protein
VFALVLGAFTHRAQGPGAAAHLLLGVVLGSLAHATMSAVVASLLTAHGLVRTYSGAALVALAVNGLALALARRMAVPAPFRARSSPGSRESG